MSFNLSKPMEWKTFKRMSKGMQEEYIAKLQNEYGVTCQKITDMLGISPLTIRRYIHAHNLKVVFTPGARMSSHQSRDWDNFVSGRSTISTVDDHAGTPELNVERSPEPTVIVKSPTSVVSNKQMHMTNMSLKFGGTLDVNEIAASLRVILGESSNGCLEIICNIDN